MRWINGIDERYQRRRTRSFVDNVTNAEVMRRMGKKIEITSTVKKRRLSYFCYVMYNTLYLLFQGKINGKRDPRRSVIVEKLRQCLG